MGAKDSNLSGGRHFALDAQIASEPDVFADVLARVEPLPFDLARPLVFSGIGTSLHAARVAADWITQLTHGEARACAVDAHDLALRYPLTGKEHVVMISHRGYKRFPTAGLNRARERGARTTAIVGIDAPEQPADEVLRTCKNESAGTFSVSYIASLAALGSLVAPVDPTGQFGRALRTVPELLARAVEHEPPIGVAQAIQDSEPLMVIGFGEDHVTADEAALKIKEGAWIWAEAMSVEFSLHGTPAVFSPRQAALVIRPPRDAGGLADGGRIETVLHLLEFLSIDAFTIGPGVDDHLWFPECPRLLRPVIVIVPFQRLTAELARVRGTDPDSLHGRREPWQAAMTALTL